MDTLNALINFTQELIQITSISGEEGPVARRILTEMRKLNFDHAYFDDNGSVIGIIEGARPGPTILLDAHCDTVGITHGSNWSHRPFNADLDNGYIYGRGAADMKGALAAMIYGAAGIDRGKITGRVAVSATVLEEVMEGVSLKPIIQDLHPDFVVIGEATELNINIGGRGRAEIIIETRGKPAHSSSPQLGINAVHLMTRVIAAIESLPTPEHPRLGSGIRALTDIISDPYPGYSVIPALCRVTYDRRLLPGETPQSVLGEIIHHPSLAGMPFEARLATGEHKTYTGQTLQGEKFFPAWELDESYSLSEKCLRAVCSAGIDARIGSYQFCTNAAYSAGVANIPTIGFGPAAEGDAHVVDERISLRDLDLAREGYGKIIEAILG